METSQSLVLDFSNTSTQRGRPAGASSAAEIARSLRKI